MERGVQNGESIVKGFGFGIFFYFLFLPFYEVFLEGNMGIYVIFLHQCVKAVLLFKKMYVLPFVLFILKRNKTDSIFEVHQVGVKTSDSHWETGKLHFFLLRIS